MRTIAAWPLDGTPPPDVPAEFHDACARVGRDLRHLPAGDRLPAGVRWELSEDHYSGFLLGLGSDRGMLFTQDTDPYLPPGPLTAYVAERVQDHLTGHEFVQWPACPGHTHPLVAAAAGAQAWWHCRRSGDLLVRIGELATGRRDPRGVSGTA
ncbi:hypothetical protein ACFVUH_04415 [Kitasatospora sp. NPDC058032]|uniref:hypothetical protein n=1 Tax=Kitasatospora sp. NPDC058032 TaxID=3346307 RepID=UPI0036D8D981